MTKLKIGSIEEDKPVTLKVSLPATVHRDLIAYSEILQISSGQQIDAAALIAPMLARFMATDRAFKKQRRRSQEGSG
jgi:hypothetical protein